MVLMRRRDKRRGNEASELVVASDSSIISSTKGVRSLRGARSGRFAADMRAQVGGYGRADKTWGIDHPWHETREQLYNDLSSRDHMEEGGIVKEELKEKQHSAKQGLSRAALKRKKSMEKKRATSISTTSSEIGRIHSDDASPKKIALEVESNPTTELHVDKLTNEDLKPASESHADNVANSQSKKRKRVNRNKKKILENQSDAQDTPIAKMDVKPTVKLSTKPTQLPASVTVEGEGKQLLNKKVQEQKTADLQSRAALASKYASALGEEFTTASGLLVRDVRLGTGRLPEIGEMLTVRYRGRLDDTRGLAFGKGMLSIVYGTGSVIAGWEEGLGTMRTGGLRHLTVPPKLGYGAMGKGNGKIPPNSTLYFEVELVRIGKRERGTIGSNDIPLPSAFQRKRIPKQNQANSDLQTVDKGKKQTFNRNEKNGKQRNRKRSKVRHTGTVSF